MVWARTKLMIHDDLLKPLPRVSMKYEGPNPKKFYKEIYNLMLITFRVSEHSIQEKEFHWSKTDPEKFHGEKALETLAGIGYPATLVEDTKE